MLLRGNVVTHAGSAADIDLQGLTIWKLVAYGVSTVDYREPESHPIFDDSSAGLGC